MSLAAAAWSTLSPAAALNGYDIDRETPYTNQWNVTWEQRLGAETTVELSYVGNRGKHLMRRADINQVPAGDSNGNGVVDRLEYVRLRRRERRLPGRSGPSARGGDNTINFWRNDGSSEYQAMQSQLISRFGRGSQLQVSYTWSDLEANDPLTDSAGSIRRWPSPTSPTSTSTGATPASPRARLQHEPGVARAHVRGTGRDLQAPSSATGRSVASSPTPRACRSPSTPAPSPASTAARRAPATSATSDPSACRASPARRGAAAASSGSTPRPTRWSAIQLGTTNQMSGRGDCEGPEFFQLDLMFFKNSGSAIGFDAQLRFEVFNVTNEENFIFVDTTLDPISVTYDTGSLATANRIVSEQIPLNFGQATATRDPRQIQLGIKLFID